HSSKSRITPSHKGRTTEIDCGVRPCICRARCPTAQPPERMRLVASSTATIEGSLSTSPSPATLTSVLAVPRSIARSEPSSPKIRRSILAQSVGENLDLGLEVEVVLRHLRVQTDAGDHNRHERQD